MLLELDGKTIRDTLESGVGKLEDGAGRFPQVSGLSYTYDPPRPVGQRIVDAKLGGEPLRPDATYRVATNDYVAGGWRREAVWRKPTLPHEAGSRCPSVAVSTGGVDRGSALDAPAPGRASEGGPTR